MELQMRNMFVCVTLVSFVMMASAQTMTASCREPVGRALGVLGELGKGKKVDAPDEMRGGVVTVSWKQGASSASVVTDTGEGKSLHTVEGVLAYSSAEQVSFVVVYPAGPWLYSVFPKANRLLVSGHGLFLGIEPGSAMNKSYLASCTITVH